MINILQSYPHMWPCNVCGSQNDTSEILFHHANGLSCTSVNLCAECRKSLHDVLEAYGAENKGENQP